MGKKDENTGHVGQFADIVRGGGHEDYEAWQKVPDEDKQKVYNDYINWAGDDYNGILDYFKEKTSLWILVKPAMKECKPVNLLQFRIVDIPKMRLVLT